MNEEQLLKRKIIDTANQAFNHNIYTYTNFLSINELSSVNKMSNELSFIPYDEWGGNPVCERKIIRFGSEELYGYDAGYPISTIRISPLSVKFAEQLNHRDYLGAIMNLGIERELVGDIIIKVPEGTVIYDDESGKVIADMSGDNLQETILKGGRGGKGNMNYATSTMQAPQYAQPGQDAQELWVRLELKVIADVGLVGFPNVGKSTFLSRVTNARPKIANYHFTTLNPNLGVVDLDGGKGFVIADIPGLIEGASEGVGLGHQFLRHIERTKVIIHIVDAASTEGRDPIADIKAINKELENYNPKLLERPQVIAANKIDVIYDDGSDPVQAIRDAFEPEGIKVYPISAVTGQGVKELLYAVRTLLDNFKDEPVLFEKEFDYDELMDNPNESFEVSINEDGVYVVNGPKIDKMLGYTNLESEKGFDFFQKFMKRSGVLDELEKLGIEEGDTVIVGDYLEFDYYKA